MRDVILKTGKPVIGIGVCLGSARIAEMVASTSFDYVMVDLLHSHYSKEEATSSIRFLAKRGGPVPMARVMNNDSGEINEVLDAGALAVIVPMVGSAEEAKRAVQSAFYPPLGSRSKGSLAAVFYGDEYVGKFNSMVKLIVMIETPEAAENAEEILSVEGIGGCLIGASDLSFVMKETGRLGQFESIVKKVIEIGQKHGVAMGISVNSPEEVKKWFSEGASFFLASHDLGILNSAIRAHEKKYAKMDWYHNASK
jgi:4-hydroxy-2-oxoheptanedioate aldolase